MNNTSFWQHLVKSSVLLVAFIAQGQALADDQAACYCQAAAGDACAVATCDVAQVVPMGPWPKSHQGIIVTLAPGEAHHYKVDGQGGEYYIHAVFSQMAVPTLTNVSDRFPYHMVGREVMLDGAPWYMARQEYWLLRPIASNIIVRFEGNGGGTYTLVGIGPCRDDDNFNDCVLGN